jgi:MOSC domain-containing protein YiiM
MDARMRPGCVVAVARDDTHLFSKRRVDEIHVVAGLGVAGDVHQGVTVKHRSRVAADPTKPNLRQVHLLHSELFDELRAAGFAIDPADLGENITTLGIDLLGLPRGTLLHVGQSTVLEVTGLRNPCRHIEQFRAGLLAAVLGKTTDGRVVRKTGIMTIAKAGGAVRPGDIIDVELPSRLHEPLGVV